MVNYRDPAKVARDLWTVVKLWHTVDGLYIWEFFTTLDYEWSVIRRRRPYQWSIWVYSLTRLATLWAVILNIIGFDVTNPINCQAWLTFELVFAYVAFASASLLIALRTIAIWNKNKFLIAAVYGVWLTNVAFLIRGIVKLRAEWTTAGLQGSCAILNTDSSKANIVAMLVTDVILLAIMLVGLFRLRHRADHPVGLTRLLWTQGVVLLVLATIAQVPPAVFICLNLSDPFNLMFQTPALITMSIASTRMYRSLSDFSSSDISQSTTQTRSAPGTKLTFAGPVQLNHMEVTVHTNSEQYPSQTSQYGLYIGTDGQLSDKPPRLGDDDAESNGEK